MTDHLIKSELSEQEIEFILAHEIGHIFHNHSFNSLKYQLPKIISTVIDKRFNSLVELIQLLRTKKLITDIIREQEVQADHFAISLTNSPTAALAFLSRFNPNLPSHTGEVFGKEQLAFTIGQRIDYINSIYLTPPKNHLFKTK